MDMMEEERKLTIIDEEGNEQEVEVIVAFEFKDTEQEYVVYTQNETDDNGNITIYVSKINEVDGESKLTGIDDDEEWSRIKDVLRELSKEEQ